MPSRGARTSTPCTAASSTVCPAMRSRRTCGASPRRSTSASSTACRRMGSRAIPVCPAQEAQRFIDQYWANLPRVKRYFDGTLAFGIKHGYVESIYGRRRILGDLTSANYQRRAAAERMAVNMPLQGSASDIMKIAMIRLDRRAGAVGAAGEADPAGPRRAGARSRPTRRARRRRAVDSGRWRARPSSRCRWRPRSAPVRTGMISAPCRNWPRSFEALPWSHTPCLGTIRPEADRS